ncbi:MULTISPECIES: hypothetical protein [unclassified Actinoplanes]|uniref:hypothetical protein n=1 Tax=unclassified Actinoplanes TaxID=2626549 RepID=UPI0002F65EF6|nr:MULTISPECIES: hypothetical protein [unclassified Actinoplanes]
MQFSDNGTADHHWQPIPDGNVKLRVTHSQQAPAINDMSTANGAQSPRGRWPDPGLAHPRWRIIPAAL